MVCLPLAGSIMVRHQIDGRRGARRHSRAAGSYMSQPQTSRINSCSGISNLR